MTHTPTPWKITNSGYDDNLIYKIQIGTDVRTVAYAYSTDGKKQEEQVANAAHIVKCVNEQPAKDALIDELVGALEACRVLIASDYSINDDYGWRVEGGAKEAWELLCKALGKAAPIGQAYSDASQGY